MTLNYQSEDGIEYRLNLVDTPGHVDFSYEVGRAITSCEGALLLIDASQGVEAQTLSNMYMALESNLEILPVINKIDLPGADIERVMGQIENELGFPKDIVVCISAKMGHGIPQLLSSIVKIIPPPQEKSSEPLKALIFDSHYDPYRGVVIHIRIFEGQIREGDTIVFMASSLQCKVEETGEFRLVLNRTGKLQAGDVGWIIAGIKSISSVRVGDTITNNETPAEEPLPGFKEVKPVLFSSMYPVDNDQYEELGRAMEKLKLNDASLVYEKDSSVALGYGFRCGLLGLLHLDVVQERLEREFGLNVVLTSPSVKYRINPKSGTSYFLDNPANFPDISVVQSIEEPCIRASIITPTDYLGSIITHCINNRGIQHHMHYLDSRRVELIYDLPLAEVIFDFYDKLKSISRGYASFEYEILGYKLTDIVKMDILVNSEIVDALSQMVFRENAQQRGRQICKKLKTEIPRQQFKIPVQAAIGGTIIARETVSPVRKDVIAKCYGGDITRKRKLLEKQREGKKRMKMVGNVVLPQSAFLAVLRTSAPSSS